MKELPGVGRYTAGAIASIAFSQATGVVDGNVIRVLSRLRVIGVESSNAKAVEMFWRLAESLVDSNRPGDFNQAMMELGATVCTPLSPQCDRCPLSMHCRALMQVKEDKARLGLKLMGPERTAAAVTTSDVSCKDSVNDIEECGLCFPKTETWNVSLGVCNYPRKAKKKPAKEEQWAVFVLERIQSSAREYLIVQRPDSGLLAGLWEFPAMLVSSECENEKMASASETFLSQGFGVTSLRVKPHCSDIHIIHKFSHIHHHYKVYGYSCGGGCNNTSREGRPMKWVSEEEMASAALSAGMRKAYTACQNNNSKVNIRKRKRGESDGKQRKLDGFFKPQKWLLSVKIFLLCLWLATVWLRKRMIWWGTGYRMWVTVPSCGLWSTADQEFEESKTIE